jgi:hypothetical protein
MRGRAGPDKYVSGDTCRMANQVLLLLIGFVLTSVLGGALGFLFQRRSWAHQHETQRRDEERAQGIKVFEEVSRLLDQRLYRMRLVYWAADRRTQGGSDSDALDAAVRDYRRVLASWNDNLNREMALVQTYFGDAARRQLEDELFEVYAEIGRALDRFVREVYASPDGNVELPPLDWRLDRLGSTVYVFNLRLLKLLQEDQLGVNSPRTEPRHHRRPWGSSNRGADIYPTHVQEDHDPAGAPSA